MKVDLTYKRSDSSDPDFITLVADLDLELSVLDGEEHAFYNKLNKIDGIQHVLVAYDNGYAVGCGAIRPWSTDTAEVKRMYVIPARRGKGIAGKILKELEAWAAELKLPRCILETGKRQPDAIWLYEKAGYKVIANYGHYVGVENSVCFEKQLP